MAKMETGGATINFATPDGAGSIKGSGQCEFGTNVIAAAAAIKDFTVSFGANINHHVKVLGATIEEVKVSGTNVTVDASLKLCDDGNHLIDMGSSSMEVTVIAWCD